MPTPLHPSPPTLAFTAGSADSSARLRWIGRHAHAVEFSPDPEKLDCLPHLITPFLEAQLPVRFHTRYFRYELGHADLARACGALEAHMKTLAAMAAVGGSVVTVHTGLDPDQPVLFSRIVENLSRLVELAEKLGITVCLENLRRGHSSDPRNILEWAEASGAMITLDIGHALGAQCVQRGEYTPEDFVEIFNCRLFEAHVYGREDAHGHHPITDVKPFAPVLEMLLQSKCAWWTVELQEPADAFSTRSLLEDMLRAKEQASNEIQTTGMTSGDRVSACMISA